MFDRTIKTAAGLLLAAAILTFCFHQVSASNPYLAHYSSDPNHILWFIQTSDTHIGASGTTDSTRLRWLVYDARQIIQPSFIVVTGDLTDSTNGNIFGYPNGPYASEWTEYRNIVTSNGMTTDFYYDLPGNHDAYDDADFSYYRQYSVQGQTQFSWSRYVDANEYHFLGVNTADNTGAPFSLTPPYGDHAGLDAGELAFIGNDLAAHDGANLTMVFGHHPLEPTESAQDTYIYYGKDEFVEDLNTHFVPLYGCGHVHDYYQSFFVKNMAPGMFYFRVASLAKSSSNQYRIIAIDSDGISSAIQTTGTWPAVLITAPVDRKLGGGVNPFAYSVPNSTENPIRALVFDRTTISSVGFKIDSLGATYPMTRVGIGPVWQGIWNASSLSEGEHTITVTATGSGTRSHTIAAYVQSDSPPALTKVTVPQVNTYRCTTNRKTGTACNLQTLFNRGETVIIRAQVKDASNNNPVANATVTFGVSPDGITITSGPSNGQGIAEAPWRTTAPNKRGAGGTPLGPHTIVTRGVSAAGYEWDGHSSSAPVTLQ